MNKTVKKADSKPNQSKSSESSTDEQIGFHKGALSTLSKERTELGRILQIVEQLMQMHVAALNDLGVDLKKEIDQMKSQDSTPTPSKKKPIEDVL